MTQEKKNYALPIVVMFFLFAMISFVTGFQNPFGVILKAQLGLNNFQSQLGAAANFIAYAIMGIPAGILLQKKGYKFSAISAVLVGLLGVAIMFLSSIPGMGVGGTFTIYLIGALIAGFSMCMLNTVVNPMLNTLGGGGKRGNQLIQFGGTCNSLAATICPIFVGILIGNVSQETSLIDARPALYVAAGVFVLAFIVLGLAQLPEPILDELKKKKDEGISEKAPSLLGALKFRHFVLGAVAIFLYLGLEIGIPQIANVFMTAQTTQEAQLVVDTYEGNIPSASIDKILTEDNNPIAESFDEASESMEMPDAVGMQGDNLSNLNDYQEHTAVMPVKAAEISEADYIAAKEIVEGNVKPGLGMSAVIAGALCGMYWFMMLIGRLCGGVIGGAVSSRVMLSTVAAVSMALLLLGIYSDPAVTVSVPGFSSGDEGLKFELVKAPINILYFVLCGLCTSVMWGGIFNLAVEGLGKYTAVASGFFMVMVCGGGIILPIQAAIADAAGYLDSYWVLVACAAYLLFYALIGSKPKDKKEENKI